LQKRIVEVCFILAVVAFLYHYETRDARANSPSVTPSPVAIAEFQPPQAPLRIGDRVPSFELMDKDGSAVAYTSGSGPLLVVLTATGCGECLQRIDKEDAVAKEIAERAGAGVWNLLVYQNPSGVDEFVERYDPTADVILADPTAGVSVKLLGGSDSTCWLLIDGEGRLAYRGPVDEAALQKAMAAL
jgi:hypothetical protein